MGELIQKITLTILPFASVGFVWSLLVMWSRPEVKEKYNAAASVFAIIGLLSLATAAACEVWI